LNNENNNNDKLNIKIKKKKILKKILLLHQKNLVKQRMAVSMEMLEDKLANCRGAVMMAYPMGLPAWDPVALCLEGEDGLDGTQVLNAYVYVLYVFIVYLLLSCYNVVQIY
jgi:cilia- and flagella-associated protein 298